MHGRLEKYPSKIDNVLKTLINKCLEKDEQKRLSAKGILKF
jgi:serine/threonine protein kinase